MKKKYILIILLLLSSCSSISNNNLEEKIVQGESMMPLIEDNSKVNFNSGFYDSEEVLSDDIKGDIVLYDYKGDKNPIIKVIVATYKDKVEIRDDTLFVNSKEVVNSVGESYEFSVNELNIMRMYINSDNNIPIDSVFILGDNIKKSNDSRKFGAVSMTDVLGKIELN